MKLISSMALCAGLVCAQVPNPTQNIPQSERPQPGTTGGGMPIYRVTVVQRTTSAINYRHRSGESTVDFRGTELMPQAKGKADVKSQKGYADIDAKFDKVDNASRYGPEYLTFVLWAVTPEGRATNLGEVVLDGDHGKLHVTSDLQAFGMIVTAEPYFAVTQPSDVVVMENIVRKDTTGSIESIDAKYELLRRGQYTMNPAGRSSNPAITDSRVPLELREARNAMQIAVWSGADRYASDTLAKAQTMMGNAEAFNSHKGNKKDIISISRQVVQTAEDARIIAIRKQDEERLAQERQAAAEREAKARADAEAAAQQQQIEAQRRAQAEADRARADALRAQAEGERIAAERAKAEADAAAREASMQRAAAEKARLDAETARQSADAARMAAVAEQQKLAADADKARLQAQDSDRARAEAERLRQEADRMRQQAESDRDGLRNQLQQQLNSVLETRETARGLIVNMSDVLFDTGKYTLKPGAREKLARVSGIVLAHPGLSLEVEGHTDNVGGDDYNQKLSEQRASSVRDFLVSQGLSSTAITARGFGKTQPVASNDSSAGRQMNRRVELVVSGDIINRKLNSNAAMPPQTPQR